MDELAFHHTAYKVLVSLMKWQLVVPFLLSTATDNLFS